MSDWKKASNGADIVFTGLKRNTKYVVIARLISDPSVEYKTEVMTGSGGGGGGGGSTPKQTPKPVPTATPTPAPKTTASPAASPNPTLAPSSAPNNMPDAFTDISDEDWYADDVRWANENGIMTGILQTEFVPSMALTRGMLAAIIGRMENPSDMDGEAAFADIDDEMYYAPYIEWAAKNGILRGMGDGTYRPEENITREQMAVVIRYYAQYKGLDISFAELDYTDADEISDWAAESVAYCKAAGFMRGRQNGEFSPKEGLTRAECAAVIRRIK